MFLFAFPVFLFKIFKLLIYAHFLHYLSRSFCVCYPIVNAADNKQRDPSMNKMKVDIDR